MTNKQKAEKINSSISPDYEYGAYAGAMKMAEWKDHQFQKYLKKMQKEFTDDEAGYYVINRIINELFKEN